MLKWHHFDAPASLPALYQARLEISLQQQGNKVRDLQYEGLRRLERNKELWPLLQPRQYRSTRALTISAI